ncbi:hypothetical protein CS063_13960 [Sporanaerobium hydrogeniformans]|uniref:Uncharacterized protein n=1 Tax=Sporanaerobium hydrogeniformans TaxID=3072179 RepID=A0AC61DAV9_9FIRM|nr:outer membrane lipoprotein carrier protein LolA [Sporanaerobium hydrogeniformans]PHV69816.1 hypothetical protein CS063_13960 [Sporanaerobium hydrogeniformans]
MFKVRKVVLFILLLMTAFTFYGCNKKIGKIKNISLPEFLKSMKSYEANVTITFLAEGQENVMEMYQKVEIGGKYHLKIEAPPHLKGYILYFDGEKIKEYNPNSQTETLAKASNARNETMLSSFLERYEKMSEIQTSKSTLEGKEVLVIEMEIPGNYKYLAKQNIYFMEETFKPIRMEILDVEGKKSIQVDYKDFKYNPEIKWDI